MFRKKTYSSINANRNIVHIIHGITLLMSKVFVVIETKLVFLIFYFETRSDIGR